MANTDYPFLDLREELREVFRVTYNWFGLRQADYSKPCGCITVLDGIRTPDPTCKRCLSTGYLFTDFIVKGYSWLGVLGFEFPSGPGVISTQTNNIIVQHNRPINKFDLILELDQDPDGPTLRTPLKILKQFVVSDSKALRSDGSRIEFWKCQMEERSVSSYRPGQVGTAFKYQGNRSNDDPV